MVYPITYTCQTCGGSSFTRAYSFVINNPCSCPLVKSISQWKCERCGKIVDSRTIDKVMKDKKRKGESSPPVQMKRKKVKYRRNLGALQREDPFCEFYGTLCKKGKCPAFRRKRPLTKTEIEMYNSADVPLPSDGGPFCTKYQKDIIALYHVRGQKRD